MVLRNGKSRIFLKQLFNYDDSVALGWAVFPRKARTLTRPAIMKRTSALTSRWPTWNFEEPSKMKTLQLEWETWCISFSSWDFRPGSGNNFQLLWLIQLDSRKRSSDSPAVHISTTLLPKSQRPLFYDRVTQHSVRKRKQCGRFMGSSLSPMIYARIVIAYLSRFRRVNPR